TNFTLMFDRFAANQSGGIYLDGVNQALTTTTNANGFGSVVVPVSSLPVGIHEVAFIGDNGQIAIAPLYVIPGVGGPTPTNTFTPTSTPTPICPGSWTAVAPYPSPVLDQTCAAQGGILYCFGGVVSGASSAISNKFDPGANTWT